MVSQSATTSRKTSAPKTIRPCDHCGRQFTKREHLLRHVRSHTKERPFPCKHCGKAYSRNDVLRRHEKAHAIDSVDDEAQDAPNVMPPAADTSNALPPQDEAALMDIAVGQQEHLTSALNPSSCSVPDTGFDECLDSYLPMEDFDFGTLDSFLTDVMTDWIQGTTSIQVNAEDASLEHGPSAVIPLKQSLPNVAAGSSSHLDKNQILLPTPHQDDEPLEDQCTVDEQYSNDISQQLRRTVPLVDTIPSTDYLNLCLKLYFDRFHTIFPVIHAPTFRPRAYNALLLTSMCSIGSLFIGNAEATAQGQQLYSRLNKAILASWETHLSEPKRSSLPLVQAALLGQTFGMLSSRSADRFMTEAFQGTMLAWARSVGAFRLAEPETPSATLTGAALTNTWIDWARAEELRRLALALYIHDVEIAALFQRTPYLRHQNIVHQPLSSDKIFEASSPEMWRRLYLAECHQVLGNEQVNLADWVSTDRDYDMLDPMSISISRSSFAAYAALASSGAGVFERTSPGFLASSNTEHQQYDLTKWYKTYLTCLTLNSSDAFCLKALCHHYSSLLYADFALLERALSSHSQPQDMLCARTWASSTNASRALLHVCLLQKYAAELSLGAVPPIHLPRIVFATGVISTAYWRFVPRPQDREKQQALIHAWKKDMLTMPGIDVLAQDSGHTNEKLVAWACKLLSHGGWTMSYSSLELLLKMDTWGISSVFATTLQAALRSGTETPWFVST